MLNVFAIARVDEQADGRKRFVVSPDDLYPAAIEHVKGVLERGARPDGALGILYDQGERLPAEAWAWAMKPCNEFAQAEPEAVAARAAALEVARLWFTEMLHQGIGQEPMTLHIERGDGRWRL